MVFLSRPSGSAVIAYTAQLLGVSSSARINGQILTVLGTAALRNSTDRKLPLVAETAIAEPFNQLLGGNRC